MGWGGRKKKELELSSDGSLGLERRNTNPHTGGTSFCNKTHVNETGWPLLHKAGPPPISIAF